MLFPKKTKYRKWQTGRKNEVKRNRPATKGTEVAFGSFGVKALTQARITSNQIEATRRVIVRTMGKTGRVWIRIFPDRPYTRKASEVGMGKGKGDPEGFVCDVRPGRVMFEVDGVSEDIAREALRKAGTKLPVKIKIVTRK
jgi:large subunit ribosomal protein L16